MIIIGGSLGTQPSAPAARTKNRETNVVAAANPACRQTHPLLISFLGQPD